MRRVFEVIDRSDAEPVLSLYDADVEWELARSPWRPLFKHDVYSGHDGLRRFFRERYEAWETIECDEGTTRIRIGKLRKSSL